MARMTVAEREEQKAQAFTVSLKGRSTPWIHESQREVGVTHVSANYMV